MSIYNKIDLKAFLFTKHILVNDIDTPEENIPETLASLAKLFNIRITSGARLAHHDMIRFVATQLGENVPEPFYRGFPNSVLKLSGDEYLFDQILNYFITYDIGDMSSTRHSVLEDDREIERQAFKEAGSIKDFIIVDKAGAIAQMEKIVSDMMKSSRPLNQGQIDAAYTFISEHGYFPEMVASKNTAIIMYIALGDERFADLLSLSDVIKLTEEINFRFYLKQDIRCLNLDNPHRKLITKAIHRAFLNGKADVYNCFEKKARWAGLLHHIHYKARSEQEQKFLDLMRGSVNLSAYSVFEKELNDRKIRSAVDTLKEKKGSAALLRKLNYIVSRCETADNLEYVLDNIDSGNSVVLMQLYISYLQYEYERKARVFSYVKYNMNKTHRETEKETAKRRSLLSHEKVEVIKNRIEDNLKRNLKGRLGRVYIDPNMSNYAMPVRESAGAAGFGVLPRGSRKHIDNLHKIRGFTYWEQVDDIDLSVIGMDECGRQTEFSWRTMNESNSDAIVYSGDETSGYYGGSEYFDVDLDEFKKLYPDLRYLIFCDNVYSRKLFANCLCKAGYMLRDKEDSGEVFEPKTVESSFIVNCSSTFCYLFAIDLMKDDFVWLNTMQDSIAPVAGDTQLEFLIKTINITDIFNIRSFFEMAATEVVSDIAQADVIVTDKIIDAPEGVQTIREYDIEKIIALMQ